MKEIVVTREQSAAQGNIYVSLGDLRTLVERTTDLNSHARVLVGEVTDGRMRSLRVVQRATVEDPGDV